MHYLYLDNYLGLAPNFSNPVTSTFFDVEAGHASFLMSLVALVLCPIIVLDGVQSVSSIVYQCIYVHFPRVQFFDSRLNLIYA